MSIECPQCGLEMRAQAQRMAVFSICPKCKGVWLSKKMYARVERSAFVNKEHQIKQTRLYDRIMRCPECRMEMDQGVVDDITLDMCPSCSGIWFDGGEFERIFDFDPETGSYTWKEKIMRAFGWGGYAAK